jgi:hypothetical protein
MESSTFTEPFEVSSQRVALVRFPSPLDRATELLRGHTISGLPEFEFRALNVAAPDIDRAATRIDNRLMSRIETAMTPAELYGKAAGSLHVNVYRLTVGMPAWSHPNGCLVEAHKMVRSHHIIERLDFQHHVLQTG